MKKTVIDLQDKYSQIERRAISENKEIVSEVASWYCNALADVGIRCTIEHFPGLTRVNADTHIAEANWLLPSSN